jgi:SPP1 family predicted phage head-tail adaptor
MKLKDKKIEILRADFAKDSAGFATETLTPICPPVWAYFRQLSGKEIFASQSTYAVEDVLFVINWRADIDTRCVVRFRGVVYDITRADWFEGYRGEVGVYGRRRG